MDRIRRAWLTFLLIAEPLMRIPGELFSSFVAWCRNRKWP